MAKFLIPFIVLFAVVLCVVAEKDETAEKPQFDLDDETDDDTKGSIYLRKRSAQGGDNAGGQPAGGPGKPPGGPPSGPPSGPPGQPGGKPEGNDGKP